MRGSLSRLSLRWVPACSVLVVLTSGYCLVERTWKPTPPRLRRYSGSVDATPLFIVLAGAYFDLTGDRAFIESIWVNIERALDWIDRRHACEMLGTTGNASIAARIAVI